MTSHDEKQTAVCQCGAEIEFIPAEDEESGAGGWYHVRIDDDGSHTPTPLTNQPPPKGHPNYDYLMQRFEEELAAEQHLKQGVVENRVEAYDEHVRKIETPGYLPPEVEDTFPEWMYNRLRRQGRLDDDSVDMVVTRAVPWADLSQDDRDFWTHEAAAYRRAAARLGFKDYDPEKSKL